MMRVGIFGNTNNVPFSLALSLRKSGVDVRMVVNRKYILHRPETMFPEFQDNYPGWIMDCSNLEEDDFVSASPKLHHVINFLANNSDALILNDIGPSLYEYCGLPAISLLTGSDITYSANYHTIDVRKDSCDPEFLKSKGAEFIFDRLTNFIKRQRNGIASSAYVDAVAPGITVEIDQILGELNIKNEKRMCSYISNAVDMEPSGLISNKKFRILNGARLSWVKPMPAGFCSMDDKGTNILIEGFKKFIDLGNDAELVLIRKGIHIKETEDLIERYGISSNIIWFDELSMSDFFEEMKKADVVCDQFGSTTPGVLAMDAMVMGKPVIANFHLDILQQYYPDLNFVCDAQTPDDITNYLLRIYNDPAYRSQLVDKSIDFVNSYCSPDAVARVYLDKFGF